jgi:hypothetical protein
MQIILIENEKYIDKIISVLNKRLLAKGNGITYILSSNHNTLSEGIFNKHY